jgi:tetratricopeptide (TPR) repeat protein
MADKPAEDSPVYVFVKGLKPPFRELLNAVAAAAPAAAFSARLEGTVTANQDNAAPQTISVLMQQAQKAIDNSDFVTAESLLNVVKSLAPRDPYVSQKLAMSAYKSKLPDPLTALRRAEKCLLDLNPDDSTDTETLGLWGAIHKRLWELASDQVDLETALSAHNKAFLLKKDYWNGINLAFLYVEHASVTKEPDEAVADRVLAKRVWKQVVAICEPIRNAGGLTPVNQYWLLATLSEAWLGLGEAAKSQEFLDEANKLQPAKWMVETTTDQRSRLQKLL